MAVIYADVLTRLDERSAKAAADELEKQFRDISARVGQTSSDSLGEALKSRMPTHGRDAAEGFMGEFMGGLRDGVTNGMPGITSAFSEISTAMKALGSGGAAAGVAAAAGVGLIAVAAVKAGEALYDVGQRFDALSSTLAVRTGKMGDDLDALNASIANVGTRTASSLEAIADIGGRVSQSLNVSGAPLENLTKQIADLNRMTGESLNIRQFGMDLRGFGIDGAQAGAALDALTAASQRTGIPLNDLMSTLGNIGPAARQLGLDFDDTAGLITNFERAGIDADKTAAGLSRAVQQFADHPIINMKTGLQDTIGQLQDFISKGNEAAAVDLAGRVFGTRSAQAFVDAIKQGTISVQSLKDGLGDTGDTIKNLDEQTSNWSDEWDKLKNGVSVLADDIIGSKLFHALDNAAKKALEFATNLLPQNRDTGTYGPTLPNPDGRGNPLTAPYAGGSPRPSAPGSSDPSSLPPWMQDLAGVNSAPAVDRAPQDIAGALADPTKPKAAALPQAPQLPYEVGYGQPPAAGESQEHWQARMADMAARHDLAEKQARLNQLSADNNATANDLISARNALVDAEMRSFEAHKRLMDAEAQKLSPATIAYPAAYGQGPRPGQTSAQYNAEGAVYEAQQKRAQAEANLQAIQASGTAAADKLAEAHNAVEKAQRDENEATMRLSAAYTENTDKAKKAKGSLEDIGVQLDADFGASKGLPGLVENLTRFLADLAFAPVFGAMKAAQDANGGFDRSKMGSGLMGMAGMAAGMGPDAEPAKAGKASSTPPVIAPYHPDLSPTYATSPAGYYPGGYAPMGMPYGAVPSGMPSGGGYMGDAALLAQVARGGHYLRGGEDADLTRGLADCTSGIEDLVNMMDGRPTAGRGMNTNSDYGGNAGTWLTQHGFLPTNAPVPGAFNVGYNRHHMEGTLPQGTNVNYGSDASVASGGTAGAAGAWGDPTFTSHYYRPVGQGPSASPAWNSTWLGGGGGGGGMPSIPSGPGAAAVGGGGGGGYAPLTPAQMTSPALTSPQPLGGGGIGTGIGPGLAGLPSRFGAGAPGGFSAPGGRTDPSQSVAGGRAWGQGTPASGGFSVGGGLIGLAESMPGTAISGALGAAGGAADAAGGFGGGTAAAGAGSAAIAAALDIGWQELNRAIGAAGQYAGALAGGALETFSLNDSALGDPSKSWLGKLSAAAAGIRPALPNVAGTSDKKGEDNPNMAEGGKPPEAPAPLDAQQAADQKAADAANGGQQGPASSTVNNNVNVVNQGASEDYTGQVIQSHLGAQAMAGQPR